MKIEFIQSLTGKKENYDLAVDGRPIVIDLSVDEALRMIDDLKGQYQTLEELGLFGKAIESCNLSLPDPTVRPGETALLFTEGHVPEGMVGKELQIYDAVSPGGDSSIVFVLINVGPLMASGKRSETTQWAFAVGRGQKTVYQVSSLPVPDGEIREGILSELILRLGRDIKIMI